jgi:hypothetical protein
MTRALPALLLVAVVGVTTCACTGNEPHSGISEICNTELGANYSYVVVAVDIPGMEPEYWEIRVTMWDYPSREGYPDDEITIHLREEDCHENEILLEGHVGDSGRLHDFDQARYWLEEPCSDAPVERTWSPVAEGTVTLRYEYWLMSIDFEDVSITNPSPSGIPDLGTITLNGKYWAPAHCVQVL